MSSPASSNSAIHVRMSFGCTLEAMIEVLHIDSDDAHGNIASREFA
jgi:hypothetical protein